MGRDRRRIGLQVRRDLPTEFKRRFAAVSGAFEILEREFVLLGEAADNLIDLNCADYRAGRTKSVAFDGASLTAAVEVQRLKAEAGGKQLDPA